MTHYDPWAHRRGEPRTLALLWTVALMFAAALTFATAGVGGVIDIDSYRPAAQALYFFVVVGSVVLWPMVRLSQVTPARPLRASLHDLWAVLGPAQAVIWPQVWLTKWGMVTIGAVAVMLVSWCLLVGSLLTVVWIGHPTRRQRVLLMAGWILFLSIGPLLSVYTPFFALASPLSAMFVLTWSAREGPALGVSDVVMVELVVPGIVGFMLYVTFARWHRSRRTPAGVSSMEIITQAEKEKLQSRLDALIRNRPVITDRIAEARALGDLKENAEYHAAREQQGLEEAEIRRLEDRIATAQVVDSSVAKEAAVVFLGSLVKLKEVGEDEIEMFKLVGEMSEEAPDEYDEVTVGSPMGEALLKARVGEIIAVKARRGVRKYEIVEID
ncbi:MAG: transcription elongation factor GreA [Phycisphaerales bacterium]|nr:transcription elongation factor GreA [Phycisphaerales bacterium]